MELVTILLSLLLSTSNLENTGSSTGDAGSTNTNTTEFIVFDDVNP